MAQIRDYEVGVFETQTLQQINQATGSDDWLINSESVLKNAFGSLSLYADSGGVTQLTEGVDYTRSVTDTNATTKEAGVGGTGKVVYAQFKVSNATYQGVDLWATFENFGTYSSNDAAFDQLGGSETVTTSANLVVPFGYTRYRFNFDSSAGDIAPTMPNGAFDGQQCILKDTGAANMTRIKGPGFYLGADSGGMYLKSRSILVTWNADDLVWEMDDAVVAEWVSGDWTIEQWALGRMEERVKTTGTTISDGGIFIAYPIQYKAGSQFISHTMSYGADGGAGGGNSQGYFGAGATNSESTLALQYLASRGAGIGNTTYKLFAATEGTY